MNRRFFAARIIVSVCAVMIFCALVKIQLVDGTDYRERSDRRTTRSVVLEAPRGEFYDRYGRDIVTNRSGYSVQVQYDKNRSDEDLNRLLHNLCLIFDHWNQRRNAEIPIEYSDGGYVFAADGASAKERKAAEEEWKTDRGFKSDASAGAVVAELKEKYKLDGRSGQELLDLASVRLDMEERGFSASAPYSFGTDVSIDVITSIKEQSASFNGVSVVVQPVRDYAAPGLATHVLGRVGNISREEYEEKRGQGYTINSMIGKQGLEQYLESYLRGTDGRSAVDQTTGGISIGSSIESPAINGRNVTLTLDLELQKTAEEALRDTVNDLSDGGAPCDAGAVVVLDVTNGDVLATASYPTYNVEDFNSSYSYLLENPAHPLINRAIMGTYTPGSTFKPCTAIAALETGVITVDEEIVDTGKYTYYKDYQPGCWLYNQSGDTHGSENVSEAIRDSCNVFFYETGRRLGIDALAEYAKKFGFGSKTGIELESEESSGSISSPQNREKRGGTWYPGDVLQAAIGQCDTLVTPIQLASYTAAIANGGILYRTHLVKSIQGTDTESEIVTKPEELSRIDIEPEIYEAVTKGMRMVVTEGTARSAFEGCKVAVAAKTGSAQITENLTNGVYIAYAPFDKPQIAVACVMEKAGGGSGAAPVVRAIIDKYFEDEQETEVIRPNTLLP